MLIQPNSDKCGRRLLQRVMQTNKWVSGFVEGKPRVPPQIRMWVFKFCRAPSY